VPRRERLHLGSDAQQPPLQRRLPRPQPIQRVAPAARHIPELPEERDTRERLAAVRGELAGGGALLARLGSLERVQAEREAAASVSAADGSRAAPSAPPLDAADVAAVQRQLETQRRGIEQLVEVVSRDARDLGIVRDAIDRSMPAGRPRQA
jgi:uncharacterized protein YjiS (DUF1127 family)